MNQQLTQNVFLESLQAINALYQKRVPEWYRAKNDGYWQEFLQRGIPSMSEEDWKHTDLDFLRELSCVAPKWDRAALPVRLEKYINPKDITLVFVNGRFNRQLSNLTHLPENLRCLYFASDYAQAFMQECLTLAVFPPRGVFTLLNQAMAMDGLILDIPARTKVSRLIHVLHLTDQEQGPVLTLPRILFRVGEHAEATVLESHFAKSEQGSYFVCALSDLLLEPSSRFRYVRAQNDGPDAVHISTTRVWQKRDSVLTALAQNLGSRLMRHDLDVYLHEEGAEANLYGLSFPAGHQHIDNHTYIEHQAPHTSSQQLYKGILSGQGHMVFHGRICVHSQAQQTRAYQLNKNLMLGRGCRVDTKPQLEIFADDVKCSHGATIGQLDPQELFYLRSRGLSEDQAARMLAQGFVDDIVDRIENLSLRRKCEEMLCPVLLQTQGEAVCR